LEAIASQISKTGAAHLISLWHLAIVRKTHFSAEETILCSVYRSKFWWRNSICFKCYL